LKSLKKAEELLLEDAGVVPFLQVGNSKLLKSTMRNIETHSIGAKYDYKKMKRLE
jgi:oligopeptide transport system substrate-binding protein